MYICKVVSLFATDILELATKLSLALAHTLAHVHAFMSDETVELTQRLQDKTVFLYIFVWHCLYVSEWIWFQNTVVCGFQPFETFVLFILCWKKHYRMRWRRQIMVDHGQCQIHLEIPKLCLETRMHSMNQKGTAGMKLRHLQLMLHLQLRKQRG